MATAAELFEEPFDADEYIERLAWRTPGGGSKGGAEAFDPKRLLEEFVNHIQELKLLDERIQRRVEKLDQQCQKEAKEFAKKVQELQKSNQVAFQHFQELDEHISYVATKVCHLGDQLEGVNTPRQRAVEAQKLMKYFNEFLDGELKSDVFTNPEKIKEAADIIQKLHLIAQELPFDRFAEVKSKIASKYHDLECQLIQEFTNAQRKGEISRMREVAAVLLHFKGYSHCVDVYIKQCQEGAYLRNDLFEDTAILCQRVNKQVGEVFSSPETIMAKLIQNIFEIKFQSFVKEQLEKYKTSDVEQYLKNLHDLYSRTTNLSSKLTEFNLGTDKQAFLSKLIKSIFISYLGDYIEIEIDYLKKRSSMILQRYYDSKNHHKRSIGSGGIQDLKERIRQRTNLPLGPSIDTHGETFLSQEVVVNLLQETRQAFERCHRLSDPSDLSKNAFQIFIILVEYLCIEHIDYALEIGLAAIPSPDSKNANLYYFDVVHQANTIFHLFDKQFNDHLMPLISSSPKLTECLQKKKEIIEQMEVKLDTGIDRTLNCMIGQMKHILATEQKKTDFKPEDENNVLIQYTNACVKVCGYVRKQVEKIKNSMDGKNVDTVLTEFGVRFHRLLYEHLQQYSYSSMGGMLAICDVAEYRKCAKDFKILLVLQLFDTLHALCNLLVVAPDNLKQVCTGEQLTNLDKNMLHAFVQLRADYKSARLVRHFS
ncbi:exocyst complex component 5 [Latimeria chalumnae]|uniref:Exocyst complex component 5 n=1 Tax=Latimeria chalumnae TaxID=7897 RepID=H3BI49_LATCH|nr:PREDICTED: exocyst complex component 5 [Latimeria chalumnae]|eukprot:XP_005986515.1 PREDICTED: exocyst complex component 5 [Latimeria chalumnae]